MTNDIIGLMVKNDEQIGYDINEQDIDSVLHYMQLNDPDHATPERAMRFLVTWKKSLRKRNVSGILETDLDNFYKQFIKTDSIHSK